MNWALHPFNSRLLAGSLSILIAANGLLSSVAEAGSWAVRSPAPPTLSATASIPPLASLSSVSPRLGSLRVPAGGSSGRTVVLVRDIHLHEEGQRNISRFLATHAGSAGLIALEAEFSSLKLSRYARFPCREAIARAAEFLLRRGRISGAVHGVITGGLDVPVVGVDDAAVYHRNVEAIRTGSRLRPEMEAEIEDAESVAAKFRLVHFSKGLRAHDARVRAYRAGQASLAAHAAYLASIHPSPAVRDFIAAAAAENALDFNAVSSERSRFAADLARRLPPSARDALTARIVSHRLGRIGAADFHDALMRDARRYGLPAERYPAMAAYGRYLALAGKLDVDTLLSDIASAEAAGYRRLAVTGPERRACDLSDALWLSRQLIDHRLTPASWARYRELRNALPAGLRHRLAPFEDFYESALRRDELMAANLLSAMDKLGARSAVFVVGGFHAPGVMRRLSARGVRCVMFTPAVTDLAGDGTAYINAFLSERTPVERMFHPRRLSVAPAHLPAAVSHIELPSLVAAAEAIDGHREGDVTDTVHALEPASGIAADARATVTGASVNIALGDRRWQMDIHASGGRILDQTVHESPTRAWVGRMVSRIMGATADGSARKHQPAVDLSAVPSRYRRDVERAVSDVLGRRPLAGRVQFHTAGSLHPRENQVETEFFAWRTDGTIVIKPELFEFATGQRDGDFTSVPGESRIYRATALALLQAGFEFQCWNALETPATPDDFRKWRIESREVFSFYGDMPVRDHLEAYERRFRSPPTMAADKIEWAAGVLGIDAVSAHRLVEPDWVYRFEVPVRMDDGRVERFVAWRVHHNDALGHNKGGFRIVAALDQETSKDLSREMTIKNSVVNIGLGGGKGGLRADPQSLSIPERARLTRGFVRELHRLGAIGPRVDVPAPDMNTDARTMSWFVDEYIRAEIAAGRIDHPAVVSSALESALGDETATPVLDTYVRLWEAGDVDGQALAVVTGKPVSQGGIIGRTEATGTGVFYVTVEAARHFLARPDLRGMRVSIQGFGNVGYYTARIFSDAGAVIVGVSERYGAVLNPGGIDIEALKAHFDAAGSFEGFDKDGSRAFVGEEYGDLPLFQDADIVIPAAREKVLTDENAHRIHPNVKLIVEAANGPITPAGESRIRALRPDLVIIPDVLANAGGVTVSHFEWKRNMGLLPQNISVEEVQGLLRDVIVPAAKELFAVSTERNLTPRESTYVVAVRRIHRKASARPSIFSGLIGRGHPDEFSLMAVMPWLLGPLFAANASRPLRAAAVAFAAGAVEEIFVRGVVQTALAAAAASIGAAAVPLAVVAYAGLFATLLHIRVHDAGDKTSRPATMTDRLRLFAFALALGVTAALLPVDSLTGLAIIGFIHGSIGAAKTIGAAGVEARTARAVARWMEARAAGDPSPPPLDELMSAFSGQDLDSMIRFSDGGVPHVRARFNRGLFERELAARIRSSRRLSDPRVASLRLLQESSGLSAAEVRAHPSSRPEGRLTVVAADESIGADAAARAVERFVEEQRAAGAGRTVVFADGALGERARAAARGATSVLVLPHPAAGMDFVGLPDLDAALAAASAFDGASSVRVAVASRRPVRSDGLPDSSRLRDALVMMIDETLRVVSLTVERLEGVIRIARLAGLQA